MKKFQNAQGSPRKSKKAHRQAAQKYAKSDGAHWVRRIIGAFKQNAAVQDKIIAGKFDYALSPAKPADEVKS